jgi:sugar phosphate isomerase/epimerase
MHQRISINSICFAGVPLSELADHWSQIGPHRVSFISQQLAEGVEPVRAALAGGSYRVETIMHPYSAGRALALEEDTWREGRAQLMSLIDSAAALGARSIYMLTGGHGSLIWEDAAAAFSAAIAPCVTRAREAGVALLIENAPALYADIHIAHTLRDAVRLAELAGIGVCIDICGCWTEAGLRESIERAMPRCGLVQVSDYVYGDRSLPSRAVPGDGVIPLRRILAWMLEAGYTGAFDLELIGPRIELEGRRAAVGRAAREVGALLESLGGT